MSRQHGFVRSIAIAAACTVGLVLGVGASDPPNFKPDGAFTGSALTGWHVVGDADWSAQNGEIIGKAKPGTNGGWLVLDKSFQDVQLYLNYKCTGECKSGVLLRAKKAADGSMTGVLVSLADGDTGTTRWRSIRAAKRRRETGCPRRAVAAERRRPTPLVVVRRHLMPRVRAAAADVVGAAARLQRRQHRPRRLRRAGRRSAAADAHARP